MPLLTLKDDFLFPSKDGKMTINLNQLVDPTATIDNMALKSNTADHIIQEHEARTKKTLDRTAALSQISFFGNIKKAVDDQQQTVITINKEQNDRGGDDLELVFDASRAVDDIEKLLLKLYPKSAANPQDPNDAKKEIDPVVRADFERKYEEMRKEIRASLFEADGNPKAGLAEDAEDLAKYRMAAWLNEQLGILRVLDEKQEIYNQSEQQLKAIVAAETKGGASAPNIANVADAVHGKGRKDFSYSYPTFFWQGEKKDALILASKAKHELDNARAAFISSLNNESHKPSDLKEAEPYYGDVADAKFNAMVGRARYFTHPLLKGVLTSTNVTKTSDWKDISDYRNKLIAKVYNTSDYNPIRGQLEKLLDDKDRGLLNDADFEVLFKFAKEKVDKADEAQKKYLEALETVVRDTNKKILNKIAENEAKGDDLNKLRLLQAFLIMSPFMPIQIAPDIISAFIPFFEGMEFADFASSMFSVDGPFGQFAIITDSLGIDDAVNGLLHLFDSLWSLPETILQSTPITELFNSLSLFSNNPMSGVMLAFIVEAYSNFTTREIEYRTAKGKIKADAKKGLEKEISKVTRENLKAVKETEEEFLKEEKEVRAQIYTSANIHDWFARRYSSHPGPTTEILEQLLGQGDGKKIANLLKEIVNNPDPDVVKEKRSELLAILHGFNKDEAGRKKLDALLKITIADPIKLYDSVLIPIKEAQAAVSVATSLTTNTSPAGVPITKIGDIVKDDGTIEAGYQHIQINYLGRDMFFSVSTSDKDFKEKLKILQALDNVGVAGQVVITENGVANTFESNDLLALVSPNLSKSKGAQDLSIQDLFENGEIKPDVALRVHNISVNVMGEERFITIPESDPNFISTIQTLKAAEGAKEKIDLAKGEIAGLPLVQGRDVEQEKQFIRDTSTFEEAERYGVAHDYLPAKEERLLWRDVSFNLQDSKESLEKHGIVFYDGSNFSERHNTPENLDRMLLLEYLNHPDNKDKFSNKDKKYGDMFNEIVKGKIYGKEIEDFISNCGITKSEQKKIVEASRLGIKQKERKDSPQTQSILNEVGIDRAKLLMVREHYYLEKTTKKDPSTGAEVSSLDRRAEADKVIEQDVNQFVADRRDALSAAEKSDPNLNQTLVKRWLELKVDEVKREYGQALTDKKSALKKSVPDVEEGVKKTKMDLMNMGISPSNNVHAIEAEKVAGRALGQTIPGNSSGS